MDAYWSILNFVRTAVQRWMVKKMKLIDEDKFIEWIICNAITDEQKEFAERIKDNGISAFIVDLVRCGECKRNFYCRNPICVEKNSFCSGGKREEKFNEINRC